MLRSFIKKSPLIRGDGHTWSRCAYYLRTISDQPCSINENSDFSQEISKQNESNINQRLSSNNPVEKEKSRMPSSPVMDRHPEDLYRRYIMTPDQPENPRLLRVAIIGAPNAGKSTLINRLIGWKLNSVSTKVHTTRQNANTMFIIENAQIIFVDTPGVLSRTEKKRYYCEGKMLSEPQRGVEEADVVGVVVDVSNKWTRSQMHTELLKVLYLHRDIPSFLILNKIDSIRNHSITKQQMFLMDVTKRLTEGEVGGKKFGRSKIEKKKLKKPENLFDMLEEKYGELETKRKKYSKDAGPKRQSKIEIDSSENLEKQFLEMTERKVNDYLTTWLQVDFKVKGVEGIKAKIDKSKKPDSWREAEERILLKQDNSDKLRQELLEMFQKYRSKNEVADGSGTEDMSSLNSPLGHSFEPEADDIKPKMNKHSGGKGNESVDIVWYDSNMSSNADADKLANFEEVKKPDNDNISDVSSGELSKMETSNPDVHESDDKVVNIELEESYQSEFLTRILSRPCEIFTNGSENKKKEADEKLEITNEILEVKAALNAVKDKYGWSGFDEVFPVCSLDGQGIDSIKEYLLKMSKPADWIYHSSVVTDQHPLELAKLCVTQSLLDHVNSYLPYVIKPEIIYWEVDDYNRLNISVDVILKNGFEMKLVLGENTSERVRDITRSARQALMDTFQCEVRFKLSIKMQKKRGSR